MFGKKTRGIQRSTFFIDKNGILQQAWRAIKKPEQHPLAVLEFIQAYHPQSRDY